MNMESYSAYKLVCFFLLTLTAFSFSRNLIHYIFGIYDIESHNNRLKQLDYSNERVKRNLEKEELNKQQTREIINQITSPIIKHVIPNVSYQKDITELEKSLHFAGLDKYMNAIQYTALILLGRIIGFTMLLILMPYNALLAIMWCAGPAILPTFLFKNTINTKREAILLGFPEFINISKSYLVSGMSFEKSVEESIYYVNKEWKELLKKFLINSETYSKRECLEKLAQDSYTFEVQEFISIVKLNLEQGIDIKDSFDSQYEKVKDLQLLAIQKKIEGRKVWTILVQAPVLLTIIVAFGLPLVESFSTFTEAL